MKIIISVAILILCVGLLFIKCAPPPVESQIDDTQSIQLVKVDDLGYQGIWMDKDTHVLYMDRGYATFPLLDADGTARTYEEVYGN